jgi:hypothetical protein
MTSPKSHLKWLERVTYDLETAKAMLQTGRLVYVIFIFQRLARKTERRKKKETARPQKGQAGGEDSKGKVSCGRSNSFRLSHLEAGFFVDRYGY